MKSLFITATGTDIGKTYITALIIKALRKAGKNVGYYKIAMSGNPGEETDAEYVKRISGIEEDLDMMVSYKYDIAVSPHLASKLKGNPVNMEFAKEAYKKVEAIYDYVCVEGSGGIICPLNLEKGNKLLLSDAIKELDIPILIIADGGLGTINDTYLTVKYAQQEGIEVKGIILNNYEDDNLMHRDNKEVIEGLTGIRVVGTVKKGQQDIDFAVEDIF